MEVCGLTNSDHDLLSTVVTGATSGIGKAYANEVSLY